MKLVQLVLTESQVSMLVGATKSAFLDATDEVEKSQLAALADFLYVVESDPTKFPVTDKATVTGIKQMRRRFRGPAQPKPNKRKRAQLRSQGGQKRTRAMKREAARIQREAFAAAMQALEIEQAEEARARAESLGIVLPE